MWSAKVFESIVNYLFFHESDILCLSWGLECVLFLDCIVRTRGGYLGKGLRRYLVVYIREPCDSVYIGNDVAMQVTFKCLYSILMVTKRAPMQ